MRVQTAMPLLTTGEICHWNVHTYSLPSKRFDQELSIPHPSKHYHIRLFGRFWKELVERLDRRGLSFGNSNTVEGVFIRSDLGVRSDQAVQRE
jgi:hypothetical protein